jgi:hypothetical protein
VLINPARPFGYRPPVCLLRGMPLALSDAPPASMAPHAPNGHPLNPSRGLSLAGLVLAALYLSILSGSFFPVQLLNPAWQLKVGSALINASPFALLGLALLHLGVVIDPGDPLLANRQRLGSRLAVAVSLGFLLLVPMLSVAAVSDQQQRSASQSALIRRADANLQALRQVVASASSGQELRERLIALNGPVLDAQAPARPLPALRAEVSSLLDQAAAQVARQQQLLPSANPLLLLPEILRNACASLALALGFAGLAQRPGRELSLLAELQIAWDRWRLRLAPARREAGRGTRNAAYLHQISDRNPDRG